MNKTQAIAKLRRVLGKNFGYREDSKALVGEEREAALAEARAVASAHAYCHWDGYPSHHGPILVENYNSREKAQALIDLGDLSSLGASVGVKHDFDGPPDHSMCLAYGRDRGEKGVEKKSASSLVALAKHAQDCDGEYLYVFGKDGVWRYAPGGVAFFGMPANKAPDLSKMRVLAEWEKHTGEGAGHDVDWNS